TVEVLMLLLGLADDVAPKGGLTKVLSTCLRQLWQRGERSHVVRRNDDQVGQAPLERDHSQQVCAVAVGIPIGISADEPGALLALRDSLELVHEVTHERVARAVL